MKRHVGSPASTPEEESTNEQAAIFIGRNRAAKLVKPPGPKPDTQGKTRAPTPTADPANPSPFQPPPAPPTDVSCHTHGRGGAGAGGGGRALLRRGRGGAGRRQDDQHVRQRLHRHRRRHGRRPAAGRRRPLQPPPPLPPRRRPSPPRPHRPGIGAGDEQALEGVPRGQHEPAGPAVHGGQAVGDPAAVVHQGQRLPGQQRRRAGPRLQDYRQLPRRRLLRLPRRIQHRHRKDRPAVHGGEHAAGEERLQRHRQPRDRLRLRRRARRRPRRDALPMIDRSSSFRSLAPRIALRPTVTRGLCCLLSRACSSVGVGQCCCVGESRVLRALLRVHASHGRQSPIRRTMAFRFVAARQRFRSNSVLSQRDHSAERACLVQFSFVNTFFSFWRIVNTFVVN